MLHIYWLTELSNNDYIYKVYFMLYFFSRGNFCFVLITNKTLFFYHKTEETKKKKHPQNSQLGCCGKRISMWNIWLCWSPNCFWETEMDNPWKMQTVLCKFSTLNDFFSTFLLAGYSFCCCTVRPLVFYSPIYFISYIAV